MKIRKATKKDLKRINEIYERGAIDEEKFQYPKKSRLQIKKDLAKWEKVRKQRYRRGLRNKRQYWIVVSDEKQIVGYGQAYLKKKETGIVESIYVDKKYRRKGIGKKILRELISWLEKRKVKVIESNAYVKNKPSIRLQEKLGFKPRMLILRLGK